MVFEQKRNIKWRHYLLNDRDERIGVLDGVTGGSVTLQGLTRLGATGSISIDDRGQEIDWLNHRVQSVYDPGLPGVEPRQVATMLLSSPEEEWTSWGRTFNVQTWPKTAVIDEDAFPDVYSLPKGANIVDAVVALIRSTGEERIAATPSDKTLVNPQTWDAGESKLTIINDLLEAAGYWSLWADGGGQFRVEPYVSPSDRPVMYDFVKGEKSIYLPEWSRSLDLSSVPNLYIVRGMGSDDAPALSGSWRNDDPDSPFSFQARGRWITRVEEGVEGASAEVFTQLAQRRLYDASSAVEHLKVRHELVYLNPNDAVYFEHDDYSGTFTIQNMTVGFQTDAIVEAEWRRTSGW